MFRARLSAAVVVSGALIALALAVAVPRASAVEPFPKLPKTMLTTHFAIHYTTDPGSTDYITQQQVTDIAGWAERLYALYTSPSWGYPAPLTNPGGPNPGLVDIDVANYNGYDDNAIPGNPAAGQTYGSIQLHNKSGGFHQLAHALFAVFDFGIWQPTDLWLEQAAAEWAAFRAENFTTAKQDNLGKSDNTGDCVSGDCGPASDLTNLYDRAGDPGWTFMEYLSERFGATVVQQFFNDGATVGLPAPAATQYLSDVFTAKGTTFQAVYNDYTAARLTGNYSITSIKGLLPVAQTNVAVGAVSGALPTTYVAVSHFGVRYVTLHHTNADPTDTGTCYAATLALNVAIPAEIQGLSPIPYYYANTTGAAAQALSVSSGNASISVPWNTCLASPDAYLSLPNPSTNVAQNGENFVITGTVTVDTSQTTAATPPPTPTWTGPTIAAPTSDVVPSILVYGAQIIRVSTADRLVRLIVFSSGPGQLQASAGSTNLGTYQLRTGNNDVRFKLPQSVVNALRKPAGRSVSASVLTLKFLSPAGTAGVTVSRKLSLFKPPPKPKKKKD